MLHSTKIQEEYQNTIDCLSVDAMDRKNILIAGDFNVWATEYAYDSGCPRTNMRGMILLKNIWWTWYSSSKYCKLKYT